MPADVAGYAKTCGYTFLHLIVQSCRNVVFFVAIRTDVQMPLVQAIRIYRVIAVGTHSTSPHTRLPSRSMRHWTPVLNAVNQVTGLVDDRLPLLGFGGASEQLGRKPDQVRWPAI